MFRYRVKSGTIRFPGKGQPSYRKGDEFDSEVELKTDIVQLVINPKIEEPVVEEPVVEEPVVEEKVEEKPKPKKKRKPRAKRKTTKKAE